MFFINNNYQKIKLNLYLFAIKKAGSNTRNGRNSAGRRLGIKKSDGSFVTRSGIILRQLGMKFLPGKNTFISKNFNIHAKIDGLVKIRTIKKKKYISVIEINQQCTSFSN